MKSNLKKTIFNPDDKLAESKETKEETKEDTRKADALALASGAAPRDDTKKYYLEFIPYEKADIARANKFKFDPTCKKWYTTEENHSLLNEFKRKAIDFKQFQKQNFLFFDHEKKEWYTYTSNEMFKSF